ncbi:MAG: hypothetical protein KDB88_09610, partial [Flavobacteriales bacterium]|nr:hypothetical protein [Flavobacteriales bacterium]
MMKKITRYHARLHREIKGLGRRIDRLRKEPAQTHLMRSLELKFMRKWSRVSLGSRRQLLLNSCVAAALVLCLGSVSGQCFQPWVQEPFGM